MYDPQKVIAIAEAEVGYLEKKSGKNLDSKTANAGSKNYTKYARDIDAIDGFYNGRKQGYAWCDVFVDWCFIQAYGLEAAYKLLCQPKKSCGAGCTYSRQYYKAKGQLHSSPKVGDQIFFWDSGKTRVAHTGIVRGFDAKYVYTIEGNTSSTSGVVANGGCVRKKSYLKSYARIAGYGRPNFATSFPAEPAPDPIDFQLGDRILKYGMKGNDVEQLQSALNALNFPCGTVDGEFGKNTLAGVKAFQKATAGLEIDGTIDADDVGAIKNAQTIVPAPEPIIVPDPDPDPDPAPEPEGKVYPVRGVILDVSDNQGNLKPAKLAGVVDYVIARSNCGLKADSKFKTYIKGFEANDIPYGAYIFTKAQSVKAAKDEADFMYDLVRNTKATVWFVDVEGFNGLDCSHKERRIYVTALVSRLRELGVERIGLYCGQSRYSNNLKQIGSIFDVLWIATWGSNDGYLKVVPSTKCMLHQYTSFGNMKTGNKVPGVPGRVDMNRVACEGALEYLTGRRYDAPTYLGVVKVLQGNVNIRNAPTAKGDVLARVAKNTIYPRREGDVPGWLAIDYRGMDAFVDANFAKTIMK